MFFFQTAETGNRTPNSSVKGSGANYSPRSLARVINKSLHALSFLILNFFFNVLFKLLESNNLLIINVVTLFNVMCYNVSHIHNFYVSTAYNVKLDGPYIHTSSPLPFLRQDNVACCSLAHFLKHDIQ